MYLGVLFQESLKQIIPQIHNAMILDDPLRLCTAAQDQRIGRSQPWPGVARVYTREKINGKRNQQNQIESYKLIKNQIE